MTAHDVLQERRIDLERVAAGFGRDRNEPAQARIFTQHNGEMPAARTASPAVVGIQEAEEWMESRGRREGGSRVSVEKVLPDGHGGAEASDSVHAGGRQSLSAAAKGVDVEKTAPRFVEERIEHQRGLARTGDTGDGGQPGP